MSTQIRPVWWLNPVSLFTVVVGGTMLAAALQSAESYELYGTPKYISGVHVLLVIGAIVAFFVGARLEVITGGRLQPTPPEADRVVRFWFWLTFGLTLLGYVVWAGVGVKNGFSLGMVGGLLGPEDSFAAEQMVREELFPTIPGVTTCTHFGVAAILLGSWLFIRGERRVIWPMAVIFTLAVMRAVLWRERTAIVALAVPAIAVWLRAYVLNRPLGRLARSALKLAPILGVVMLLLFFGTFEYLRSWQTYQNEFNSFAEFTLWRVGGYFTTAHNNGAMTLVTQSPLPLPYWTLQPIWEFPGVSDSSLGYPALTGFDPWEAHFDMLERYGTLELNNKGGVFMPLVDYGLLGYLVFWLASGFLSGRLYRGFLVGTLAGLTLYPIVFLSILNAPLILYVCFPASFPPLVALVAVLWFARRAAKAVPATGPIPYVVRFKRISHGHHSQSRY